MVYYKHTSLDNIVTVIDGQVIIEEWEDIKDFEGMYQVSSFGRVKGCERKVAHKSSKTKTIPARLLKISPDSQGYLMANLWKDNKGYHKLVHRLVAIAFIENKGFLPEVNHVKGIKWDNRASQLEWISSSNNQLHSFRVLKRKGSTAGRLGADNHLSKKVKCDTFDMEFVSVSDAANQLGLCQSAISFVLLNQRSHASGLVFKYI